MVTSNAVSSRGLPTETLVRGVSSEVDDAVHVGPNRPGVEAPGICTAANEREVRELRVRRRGCEGCAARGFDDVVAACCALRDNDELVGTRVAVVGVQRVIIRARHDQISAVNSAAEPFDAVVRAVVNLNVLHGRTRTNTCERDAVEFVARRNLETGEAH